MEENQENKIQNETASTPETPEVGFPLSQPIEKKGINKWLLILFGLIILGGGGIFFFTQRSKEEGKPSPSPSPTVSAATSESISSPTLSPTPFDKAKVKIEIQNGTGITGEAGYLQGVLKTLGYSDIKAGNADKQDYTNTIVTFSKNLSQNLVDEITKKLEEIYKNVETKTSSTLKTDVMIITGLRKGATPKPSPTATPKSTATPSPAGTKTPSPTPTATPTATP